MALVCAISWVVVPVVRFARYLATEPRIERTRFRAVAVSLSFALLAFSLLYIVPFPNAFTSPGICEAHEYVKVANKASGYVERVIAHTGKQVASGEPLMELRNEELEFKIRELQANIIEVKAMRQKAMLENLADVNPIESLLSAISERYERLIEDTNNCTVRAETSGVWVAPDINDYLGMWIQRGTPLGQIVNESDFDFTSAVTQQDVSRFFSGQVLESKIRLSGEADTTLGVKRLTIIPVEQTKLPSAALGFAGGGDLPVNVKDKSGVMSSEPFYEVRLEIKKNEAVRIMHGRTGWARFTLTAEPLLKQWMRTLIQLIQKRYRI
jgi:putative peptide zinc metalloprotease protein